MFSETRTEMRHSCIVKDSLLVPSLQTEKHVVDVIQTSKTFISPSPFHNHVSQSTKRLKNGRNEISDVDLNFLFDKLTRKISFNQLKFEQ